MTLRPNDFGAGLVILGVGRGSAELIDMLDAVGRPASLVVLDDRHPACEASVCGAPVVGRLEEVGSWVARGHRVLCGIASSKTRGIRSAIAHRLALPHDAWATFIHPAATVSSRARVGSGVIVYPGVHVAVDADVSDQAALYPNAVVHHDTVVGPGSILCAGVLLAGKVRVGADVYVGIGACVRDDVTIGDGALVGMGAVVTRDVAAGAVVKGVPAR